MDNKLQKDEFYFKGDLGTITEAHSGKVANIDKFVYNKVSGCVTLTVSPIQSFVNEGLEQFGDLPKTEDADFEIIQPKKLNNG